MNKKNSDYLTWWIKEKGWWLIITNETLDNISWVFDNNFLNIDFDLNDDINKFLIKIEELLVFLKSFTLKNKNELKKLCKLVEKMHIYIIDKKTELIILWKDNELSLNQFKSNYLRIWDIILIISEDEIIHSEISKSSDLSIKQINILLKNLNKKFSLQFLNTSNEVQEILNIDNIINNLNNDLVTNNEDIFKENVELVKETCLKIISNENDILDNLDLKQIGELKVCISMLIREFRDLIGRKKGLFDTKKIDWLILTKNWFLKKALEETNIIIVKKEIPIITNHINVIFWQDFDKKRLSTSTWSFWNFINDFRKVTKFIIMNKNYLKKINKESLNDFLIALNMAYEKISEVKKLTNVPSIEWNSKHSLTLIKWLDLWIWQDD